MATRITTAVLLATIAFAAAPAGARAGSYHVYTCRTPAGESAPAMSELRVGRDSQT